jgi:hypothetical protein
MKKWEDKGSGQWKLTITNDQNPDAAPSVFYGTRDEILDKLADSQENANGRIEQLRRTSQAAAAKPLSPEERLQTVTELNNPATVDRAVTRVIESVVGPVSELRQERADASVERQTRAAVTAAEAFANRTPDWYPSDFNKNALVRFLQTRGLDPTKTENYTLAFEELSAAQLLQPIPAEPNLNDETEAEGRNAPTPTQRPTQTRFSTSIRQSDISGTAPKPTVRLKYTREQIANMSASTYKRLMQSEPELTRCVEYYAQQDRRRQKAS